jgi:hypothetical protein
MYRHRRPIGLYFWKGGTEIECLVCYLVTTQQGGILMYHRDGKGQRGVAGGHIMLCSIHGSAHRRIASLLDFLTHKKYGGRLPTRPHCIVGRSKTTTN